MEEQKKYYGLTVFGSLDKRKYRRCIDCGELFWVKNKDNQTVRCDECWKKHQQYIRSLQNKRYYKNKIK